MSFREDVKDYLTGDTALMAILAGGIHAGIEISRNLTPTAFNSGTAEIMPCALIKMGTEAQTGPYPTSTRAPIEIWFYERQGYASIDPAKARVLALLNDRHWGGGAYDTRLGDDIGDQADDSLSVSMSMIRFYVSRIR